ncbi:MAG TPA: alpha/beta hydrolase [Xanthobacteraceae bacterium]|jgi:pimeloyl-ACP methyl ester carboxylesterase|nr:alpha/beta hydrolase [Xanthobacteraceae bacterium]
MGESRFIAAQDGLRLHALEWGDRRSPLLPVVCLPGLTRTAEDFATLAAALAADRRVLALDYRGRGRSDYDPNPEHYAIAVEAADVVTVLSGLAAAPAVVVGTSRGGLIAMTLAAAKPQLLAGVVLNDIGPVVEIEGMMRIKGYVGRLPQPASYQEGAEMLRRISGNQFPELGAAEWLAAANRGWRMEGGRLVTTYDPALARTLDGVSADKPFPTMWPQFDAMAPLPLLVVHGANSDVLSAATVAAMQARRPDMERLVVPDQGHAPLLAEPATIRPIAAFAARCDALRGRSRH